jgi:hypothetical protein
MLAAIKLMIGAISFALPLVNALYPKRIRLFWAIHAVYAL